EIMYQEVALYKVPFKVFADGSAAEELIRRHNARVLLIETEFVVIEKTGHEEEIEALLEELQEMGIYEFVRSGRVAIVKPMERLNQYLQGLAEAEER
ncbi:MAG: acetolactate synthase small subunit, partial [Saprospiraceae bacterium]